MVWLPECLERDDMNNVYETIPFIQYSRYRLVHVRDSKRVKELEYLPRNAEPVLVAKDFGDPEELLRLMREHRSEVMKGGIDVKS